MKSKPHDGFKLTDRELKCLILAAEDKSLMATAKCMHVSRDTVKKYRKMILKKFGCQTMVGALASAFKNNIFDSGDGDTQFPK